MLAWHVGNPDSCGPVRGRDQLSRAQRTATATRARVDRGAVVLAPGPHDGGGAPRDLARLHAPERASDRSADRAGEPVVTAAGGWRLGSASPKRARCATGS